jgi:hypothetical protein
LEKRTRVAILASIKSVKSPARRMADL